VPHPFPQVNHYRHAQISQGDQIHRESQLRASDTGQRGFIAV